MAGALNPVDRVYHQPIWGRTDPALRHALAGSAAIGCVVLLAILVAPAVPPRPVTIEQVPERIARLILEKPRPAAPSRVEPARLPEPRRAAAPVVAEAPRPAATPAPAPQPRTAPQRRAEPAPVAPDQGVRGREQAKSEVAANLQQVSGSLDRALGDLAQALPKAGTAPGAAGGRGPGGRSRQVRAARSGDEVGGVEGRVQLGAVDVGGSGLAGGSVSIAALGDLQTSGSDTGGGATADADVAGAGPGTGSAARSNAALLAVVRRYAAGIQFCYENELKRNPGLRGKLVFSLTVDATGRVADVAVVEDALGAGAVADCALAQIRDWKFPPVDAGVTTFRAPFVFTPPQ
ncbi:MAG: AgmX/PglI C-terminal domain-containing protein [bacterium]|nr:AgmX/PglI C-terminal domain-containing protein [bacterium]